MEKTYHKNDSSVEIMNVCNESPQEKFYGKSPNETKDSELCASSHNLFVEIPVKTEINFHSTSDSEDSVIFSNEGEDENSLSPKITKSKELLTEISEILVNLSDDERFLECMNFSNHNGILNGTSEKKRSSVDMIFTYNVLNILFNKLKELKSHFEIVQADNEKFIKERNKTEAEQLAHEIHLAALDKTVDEQKQEIVSLKERLNAEIIQKEQLIDKFETDLNSMKKKVELAISEKDSSVMKYVKNEAELINLKKENESLTKKIKNLQNEQQDFIKKSHSLMNEKMSVVQLLNAKKTELANTMKNMEKYKEELSCKDIKSKWIEENLIKELDECKEKNDALIKEKFALEIKLSKYESSDLSSTENQKSDENISSESVSEHDKIQDAEKIPERENTLTIENESLNLKIQKLEMEKLTYEKNILDMKQIADSQNEKIKDLQNELNEMEILRSTLKQLREEIDTYHEDIKRLKETNEELLQDVEICREREAELLNFTEKLTAQNVVLQSNFVEIEAKKNALEAERIPIENRIEKLESEINELKKKLNHEIETKVGESLKFSESIAQKNKEIESLNAQLEEQQAENQSLKHKYSTTIRELTKEVQQYRKYKQYDIGDGSSSDSVLESRTSSCNSLNEHVPKIEPDRQTLIERIVKLQKINMKHVEKIEFLEEHIAQLLTELKKKSKVLQHYIIREHSGALSSDVMEQNKLRMRIQAEMTKYGGIMASIYNSKSDDGAIPLELSIEINRKLQAVLEDTLLKNITLKENIETLGKEIDRLNALNKTKES